MTAQPRPKLLSLSSLAGVAAAAGLTALTTVLIFANSKSTIAEDRIPVPVAVTTYQVTDGYERAGQYVGVINAVNDGYVGFEVPGTLKTIIEHEGLRVTEGDVLATLDTDRREAQLRAAQADLSRLDAQIELADLKVKRLEKLIADGLASAQSFDEARLGKSSLVAQREAAQAQVEAVQLDIEKSSLIAPFNGIVAEKTLQVGAVVNAGTPVLRLVANDAREAHIGVPANRSQNLVVGELYSLEVAGSPFEARLKAVRTDVSASTLTVGAVFDIPKTIPTKVGESVTLNLAENIAARGGWVPLRALIEGEHGLWNVFVIKKEDGFDKTAKAAVEVLYVGNQRAFVRGTLSDGDQLLATGIHRIAAGTVVRPIADDEA